MLNEGLDRHDLDYLVLPIISVDEYESKIDNRKAIVVGFFVAESDPANDLSNFIEKSNIDILDTDVSPAPTEDGYYMVFVEFSRNLNFPKRLLSIIEELSNITNNDNWSFVPYGSKPNEQWLLTKDEILRRVNLDPLNVKISDEDEDNEDSIDDNLTDEKSDTNKEQEAVESISRFLKNSLFENYEIEDQTVQANYAGHTKHLGIKLMGYGVPNIPVIVPQIGDNKLAESNALQAMLGPNYQVYLTEDGYLIISDRQYILVEVLG